MNPVVSVLITAYNREAFIGKAIESVLSSTWQDFELIIVDDHSTDNSFYIAEQYAKQDIRIHLYRNEKNLGQFQNRNKAISFAKAPLIKFLDSDDEFTREGLEIMVKCMLQFPDAGIGVPVKNVYRNDLPHVLSPHESVSLHYKGENHLCYGPTATIFTKKALEYAGLFDEEYGILTDTLLNIKLASCFPTVLFAQDLVIWRRHDAQVTEEQKDDARMIGERDRIMKASLAYNLSPLSRNEKDIILKNFVKINSLHFIRHILRGRWREAVKIRRETGLTFFKIFKAIFNNKRL